MALKVALLLAFAAQVIAAGLALRLNFRYRIYSAWFFVSAAASVGAILRLSTLIETWNQNPSIDEGTSLWTTALASLFASVLLMAAMGLIEPFFQQVARAEETLRREHDQLSTIVRDTEEDLRVAQRIQQLLLPTGPPQVDCLDIYGASDPAEWTSGDYFDYLLLGDESRAVVIADVSGHGLGPALWMSSTRASFRALAPTVTDVGALLTLGNRAVADAVSGQGFVTAFAAKFDAADRRLHFAAAGHTAYLAKNDRTTLTLAGDSPPLGVVTDAVIGSACVEEIEGGDTLVLITDGILEARNRDGEMYGEERVLRSVADASDKSAEQSVATLLASVRAFIGEQPQEDDITAVIVKFDLSS